MLLFMFTLFQVKNSAYKENLLKLKNLVLVKFAADTIVQPKESEWFGYFVPGQDKKMYKMEDSPLYKEVIVILVIYLWGQSLI